MKIQKKLISKYFNLNITFESANEKQHSLMDNNSETLGIIIDDLMTQFGKSIKTLEKSLEERGKIDSSKY